MSKAESFVEYWHKCYGFDKQVEDFIDHTRDLEAMLKEHQFCSWRNDPGMECPECGQPEDKGHSPDCELARLIE